MNFHRRGRRRTEPVFFVGVREEDEPGRGLAGLGQGSAAARPLDSGVLTRWGAHAPARGPATAPRLAPPPARSRLRPAARKEDWAELVFVVLGRTGLK